MERKIFDGLEFDVVTQRFALGFSIPTPAVFSKRGSSRCHLAFELEQINSDDTGSLNGTHFGGGIKQLLYPVEVGRLSHYLQGLSAPSQVVGNGIFSINSILGESNKQQMYG